MPPLSKLTSERSGAERLVVNDLSAGYGAMSALQSVDLYVDPGECVAVLGPNGAGKTTLLKTISGTLQSRTGCITLGNLDMSGDAVHERARRGIVHVPQGRRVFGSLTVLENLELGAFRRTARALRTQTLKLVFELFPVLSERRTARAGSLSGGQQQMLAIGRGLMAQPSVLMLDEPSLGLAPKIVSDVFDQLKKLRGEMTLSILVAEQRAPEALDLSERAYVLAGGQIRFSGSAKELGEREDIGRLYLRG